MKNYRKCSKNDNEVVETQEVIETTEVEETVEVIETPEVEETPEVIETPEVNVEPEQPKDEPTFIQGVVIPSKLNVRKEANKDSSVVSVVAAGNKVNIYETESTDDLYKVTIVVNNTLVEGYCVKEFISVK